MLWSNEKSSQIGRLGRSQLLQYEAAALGGGLLASGTAQAQRKSSPTLIMAQGSLEKISFGTNWYAQAEHGSFYQALATGIYREYGLDVTIQMGGPGINVTQLLVGGAVDTVMGASGTALSAVKGWYSFLQDPRPAFRLIQQDNPNMSDAQLAYSHEKLQEYGIIKSGDAMEKGIGAMTHERWQTFFDTMTVAGVYPPTLPYQNAYTLDFINKGAAAYQAQGR